MMHNIIIMNTVDGSEDLDLMPNDHVIVSSVSSFLLTHPCIWNNSTIILLLLSRALWCIASVPPHSHST